MTKTICVELRFIAEGDEKIVKRIVDVESGDWFTIDAVKKDLDVFLDRYGDITIPETSC
jgi:hypothetical protein